jgi:hypothetical protein
VGVDIDSGVAYTDADQVQEISVNHEQPLTEIYQLGDVDPQELKEGHIAISGTIRRKFETGNFSASGKTFFGMATESGVKTPFWIALFPEGDALPKVLASNAKFHNWRGGVDLDGDFEETVDFRALALALS